MLPYIDCPTYESTHFRLRQVREADAADLLECYADPLAAPLFNSDNCTSNFIYHTQEEMLGCIHFWMADYARHGYVRFAILDKVRQKAVGTIEFFARNRVEGFGMVGVLRLDLASRYETEPDIAEILAVVEDHFYAAFEVGSIITKAIPKAKERIQALRKLGYSALPENTIMPYGDYWARVLEQHPAENHPG